LNPTKLGIVLKIAANSLATITEDMDDDWLFREVLMHQKGEVSNNIPIIVLPHPGGLFTYH
jgi:hypothetical protein